MEILLLFLILGSIVGSDAIRAIRSLPPYIYGVYPKFGGTEGGTKLTIFGQNFLQLGLWSELTVLIGGKESLACATYIISYHIICHLSSVFTC